MLVKCKTEGCKNYDVLIENNRNDEGDYSMGFNEICQICGNPRVQDDADNYKEAPFNIDHTNLNSKRLYENKVRKYKGYE